MCMSDGAELLKQARACREAAQRARRLADGLTSIEDRARLLQVADDLERDAADLERGQERGQPTPPRDRGK